MINLAIATRLATLGSVAAIAGAFAIQAAPVDPVADNAEAANTATLRVIEREAAQGQQVAYREVDGRLVIDSKISTVRTAALD